VEAGRVAGRLKNNARFVMLVPKVLDPVARGRKLPLPDERPSAQIAKLFPQAAPKELPKTASPATQATSTQALVPLPAARPKEAPAPDPKRRHPARDR